MAKKKIAIICPYPLGSAPGQRYRFEQYLDQLPFEYELFPFYSVELNQLLYKPGHVIQKARGIISGLFNRLSLLFGLRSFSHVYIFREATPLGPPWFEYCTRFILRKPIIFDFDDAIWLPNSSEANRWMAWTKWHRKFYSICKWSTVVTAGNRYLADRAALNASDVRVIPTVVSMAKRKGKRFDQASGDLLSIGWTGSNTTVPYLDQIFPCLGRLQKSKGISFRVIADHPAKAEGINVEFSPWRAETEYEDLLQFGIGIMPLEDNAWNRGKCGFKLIQYMALGIIPVASRVGANLNIIQHGVNGFLCETEADWEETLSAILSGQVDRVKLADQAFETAGAKYSVEATAPDFLALFE